MTNPDAVAGAMPVGAVEHVPPDKVFAAPQQATDFKFDSRTAGVFDDMVGRSVPFYHEIQRMTTELAADFAVPGTNLYDLGCATATTLIACEPVVHPDVHFVGIDNSAEMLAKAQSKLDALPSARRRTLVLGDLHEEITIENASVVILTLTLQFVRPLHRERLIRTIAEGMNPQGCLILVEKLTEDDTLFNRLFIKYYYDMKRRHGYSDLEISQKREALENVLIPYHLAENEALCRKCGFTKFQTWFRWYNFSGMIAVK
ncbi:MAG: carboxy-S-adenosyl-L-methionine synthase CmoA [Gemmatimonadetes bacterium]|nr:carboxy-S-adenosyl-L-methionine synthase CmoA [Gemmatimonadota bacterium]